MTGSTHGIITRADDAGLTRSTNDAIVDVHRNGYLRNVSVQAVAPQLTHAAAVLAGLPNVCVGLHVTLTCEWRSIRWKPLSEAGRVPALLADDGTMLPSLPALQARNVPPEQAVCEAETQLQRLRDVGLKPAYIDFHMGVSQISPTFDEAMADWIASTGLIHGDAVEHLPLAEGSGKGLVADTLDAVATMPAGRYRIVRHPILPTQASNAMRLMDDPDHDVVQRRVEEGDSLKDEAIARLAERRGIKWLRYDD